MTTGATRAAGAAILAGLLVAGGAGAAPGWAQETPRVIERTDAFDGAGALRIMVLEGSVRVRAWEADSVRVAARLFGETRDGFYMGVSRDGTGAKLGVEGSGRAELELLVPRGASVWVKTAGGAILIAGIEGSLDLVSVTGDIRVEGSPRAVHAESMAGTVEVAGEPRVARIRTGAGPIEVRGGGPDLTLTSVSGGIDVTTTAPMRRVRVETVGGGVVIRGALATTSMLEVDSHDGAVELALARGTSAEFVISTLEGGLRNTLTDGGVRKATGLRGRELAFTSGAGGAEVTVRTFSGDVTIRPWDPDGG